MFPIPPLGFLQTLSSPTTPLPSASLPNRIGGKCFFQHSGSIDMPGKLGAVHELPFFESQATETILFTEKRVITLSQLMICGVYLSTSFSSSMSFSLSSRVP